MVSTPFTTILIALITIALGQDFEIRLTHSAINKLVQYAIPLITEHVESQKVSSQTIEGVMDLQIGTIYVRRFEINITLNFDEENQKIDTLIHDLLLSFWPFRFSASKQWTDNLGLSCNTLITPTFSDWNFAFKFDSNIDDKCMINLDIIDESVEIVPGKINMDIKYLSDFCNNLVDTAVFVLDLENILKQEIINKMPSIITNDLQQAINDGLQQMRYIQGINIGLCYTMILITEIRFGIAGDFITNLYDIDLNWNINKNGTIIGLQSQSPLYLNDDIEQFTNVAQSINSIQGDTNKDLIAILFVVFVIVAILCGIGISYAICVCLYKPKFKKMNKQQFNDDDDGKDETQDENEVEPMINETK